MARRLLPGDDGRRIIKASLGARNRFLRRRSLSSVTESLISSSDRTSIQVYVQLIRSIENFFISSRDDNIVIEECGSVSKSTTRRWTIDRTRLTW
ncbi:hypothetical protein M6B38_143195 [Iris pallida]|uniref:Uncharacterized protein n=1 Tax=Iris pallida TaxID=29817 RepID=A0AAX6FBF9_IRIPA|nr:hypothetical protein M6B38_143195 [Iris pallida]